MAYLQAQVFELERQLEDRMVAEGLIPDPRPRLKGDRANRIYRDFHRLVWIEHTGMGALNVNVDPLALAAWAEREGEPLEEAEELFFSLRDSYRAVVGELTAKK